MRFVAVVDLDRIFKAYDVRGVVPDDLNEDIARKIGAAFAEFSGGPKVVIGRDCRLSSPDIAAALSEGITSRGTAVVDLGLASTDLLYFASGSLDLPAVMITASHNPKQYNGLKFCLAGARPVGVESGLLKIRALTESGLPPTGDPGVVEHRDLLPAYVEHVLTFLDASRMRPLIVAIDTASCTTSSRSSTARSRTTPPIRSTRRISASFGRRSCSTRQTSASHSTATQTGCS
jgi:phosphomannomutase